MEQKITKAKKEISEFEPMQVGVPDNKKRKEIIKAYEGLILAACEYQTMIEYCIDIEPDHSTLSLELLFDSMKGDTKDVLTRKYIEMNKLSFPGLSIDKLIENDLVSTTEINEAVDSRKIFDAALKKAKATNFNYSLKKLNTDGESFWELTPEFYEEVEKYTTTFTQSEKQNQMVEIFQRFANILNELNDEGIIRIKNGANEIILLSDYVDIEKINGELKFILPRYLFKRHRLNRFYIRPTLKTQNK